MTHFSQSVLGGAAKGGLEGLLVAIVLTCVVGVKKSIKKKKSKQLTENSDDK